MAAGSLVFGAPDGYGGGFGAEETREFGAGAGGVAEVVVFQMRETRGHAVVPFGLVAGFELFEDFDGVVEEFLLGGDVGRRDASGKVRGLDDLAGFLRVEAAIEDVFRGLGDELVVGLEDVVAGGGLVGGEGDCGDEVLEGGVDGDLVLVLNAFAVDLSEAFSEHVMSLPRGFGGVGIGEGEETEGEFQRGR